MKLKRSDGRIFRLFIANNSAPANSLEDPISALTIQALAIVLFSMLCLCLFAETTSASMTLFGPKEFQRTTGKPDVFHETFEATEGEGQLEIFNGGMSSNSQVASAHVVLNGKQIFGPNDFKKGEALLQTPVMLEAQNTLEITLASKPGTYVVVRFTQSFSFEEDDSGVIKTDLAVTNLELTPDRCAPQTDVTVKATVMNWGRQESGRASLIFTADGSEIARKAVNSLPVGASTSFSISWKTQDPGRHQFWARVEPGMGMFDTYTANNSYLATLRVSGESSPVPELEFSPPQFNVAPPAKVTVKVKNPSFADLSNIWLYFSVTGPSPLPQMSQNSAVMSVSNADTCEDCFPPDFIIPFLAAGEVTEVQFAWPYDTIGQYVVEVRAENLPRIFPMEERTASWDLVLPTIVAKWTTNQPLWSSLGPWLITNNFGQGPPNTGRIAVLAIHPKNPNIIYAADASYGLQITGTGIWKTTDSGQHWKPLGDKFPQMNIMTIALDPTNPDIVYCAGGVWRFDPPSPVALGLPNQITGYIFKSIDGGQHWRLFGHPADGYSKLVVRRFTGSNKVVIYAASNRGVLRYISNNPLALSSQESEWLVILDGKIADVVVDPTDPDVVFAVRHTSTGQFWTQLDGLYRTKTGLTAKANCEWSKGNCDWSLRLGFTVPTPGRLMFVDLFKANPKKVYLLTMDPTTSQLRTSENGGDDFPVVYSFPTPVAYGGNPPLMSTATFLRAHPSIENFVYVGCTLKDLFRIYKQGGSWYKATIPDIHADQHAMEFFPDSTSFSGWGYILGNDGGVYRGEYDTIFSSVIDNVTPINNGLISAEFYDTGFDVSPINPDVMIGGTQDNGVILSQPFNMWKWVATGDGTAAVIAPSDPKVMYAKDSNGLHSGIIRSIDGGVKWQGTKHIGVVDGGGYIFTSPGESKVIYVGGPQLQKSINSGDNWGQIGPNDPQKKGNIVQVVSPDILHLYAGTNEHGQIWFRTESILGSYWNLVHEHPDPNASVKSMALAPSNPNVLYVAYANCTKDKRLRRFQLTPGSGWTSEWITGNLPEIHSPTNTKVEIPTIAVHPTDEDILFVGTDKGVYLGVFSGTSWYWVPFNNGLPLVRISKLISVPLTGEIRAATYGRGAWKVNPSTSIIE